MYYYKKYLEFETLCFDHTIWVNSFYRNKCLGDFNTETYSLLNNAERLNCIFHQAIEINTPARVFYPDVFYNYKSGAEWFASQ